MGFYEYKDLGELEAVCGALIREVKYACAQLDDERRRGVAVSEPAAPVISDTPEGAFYTAARELGGALSPPRTKISDEGYLLKGPC